jgi:hypothetical protein
MSRATSIRSHRRFKDRARAVLLARSCALCETLEQRRLLTTLYSWTVDQAHPHSIAYLQPGVLAGSVQIRLDNATSGMIDQTLSNSALDSKDLISSGTFSGFIFVDQVHAAQKPSLGIEVQAASGGTLQIEAGPDDQEIRTKDADTIITTDTVNSATGTDSCGGGIADVVIVNTFGGAIIDVVPDNNNNWTARDLFIETGAGTGDTITIGGAAGSTVDDVTVHTGAGDDVVNVVAFGNAGQGATTATIDFDKDLGSALGGGNVLNVGDSTNNGYHCFVTLARAPGSSGAHDIVLDQISVEDYGTITLAAPATVGDITLSGNTDAEIQAPLTVPDGSFSGGVFFAQSTSRVEFTGGASDTLVHQFETDTLSNPDTVTIDSGADITIEVSSIIGDLEIPTAGKLSMTQDGSHCLLVSKLYMGDTPTGILDLRDNDMVIDYNNGGSAFSPLGTWDTDHYTGITGYIASGRNGGDWSGNGIISSVADSGDYTTLAIAEGTDAFNKAGDETYTFDDQTVSGLAVVIKFTYGGDATIDGKINVDDYGHIDFSVGLGGQTG